MKADGKNAAIIGSHGHGKYGKEPVAGMRMSQDHEREFQAANYNYAEQMARAGFLTISPDLSGFGERRDGYEPVPVGMRATSILLKGRCWAFLR
jgi:hypothetical protein